MSRLVRPITERALIRPVALLRGAAFARRHASALGSLIVVVLAAGALLPSAASAEEQPAILKAYGLDWIERVSDDAWPQPKAERPVICLLDTGVDVTPDTPANDPNGPIVDRLALDGGTGTSQGTGYPYDHGTQMASIIAAPRNDWGTVGVFPQGRIVSIRVTDGTDTYITPEAVRLGANACMRWGRDHRMLVAAVVMAESNYAQRPSDTAAWKFASERTTDGGGVFVAAIGNDADAQLVAPLAVNSIVSIAAGDESGALCSFSPPVDSDALIGPGCSTAGGWPTGSSAATAAVAALVATHATRHPDVSSAARIAWLRSQAAQGAVIGAGAASVDFPITLASELTPAPAPTPGPTATPAVTSAPTSETVRLFRPDVSLAYRHRRVTLTCRGCPAGVMHVRLTPRSELMAPVKSRLGWRVRVRPTHAALWITGAKPTPWRSLTTRTKVAAK